MRLVPSARLMAGLTFEVCKKWLSSVIFVIFLLSLISTMVNPRWRIAIQHCGGLTEREMAEQVLDSMDLEREWHHYRLRR